MKIKVNYVESEQKPQKPGDNLSAGGQNGGDTECRTN